MTEREALLRLTLARGIGPASINRLRESFLELAEVFNASEEALRPALAPARAAEFIRQRNSGELNALYEKELRLTRDQNVRWMTVDDSDYPALLKQMINPPAALYVCGDLLVEDEAAVAIVGTRRATPYGLSTAGQFAKALSRAGVTVVSGLAEGIDRAAHEGALEAGGRTIAVVGHGLSMVYPPHHRGLAEKIAQQGAVVSEFPMGIEPEASNFPRRNRVIAGLSLGTLVVEAPARSGALITAREAGEIGRAVFAIPGPVSSPQSQGSFALLKDGARLVTTVGDIFEELAPVLKDRIAQWSGDLAAEAAVPSEAALAPEEAAIVRLIPVGSPVDLEQLAAQIQMPAADLLSSLTELELKGVVRQMPGHGFSRTA